MSECLKYTLYQKGEEIGIVYSKSEDDILPMWRDFKSDTDGKDCHIWNLKELGYHAGIRSDWGKEHAYK